jgi:hypothetical protein
MKAEGAANSPTSGVGALERAMLADEIHDLYDGQSHGDRLLAAFRAAALYVPLAESEPVCSAETDGVQWLYAFTSPTELERFARTRVEAGTDPGWASGRIRYWTVLGSRLLDVAVPAVVIETRTPHRGRGRRGWHPAVPHAAGVRARA